MPIGLSDHEVDLDWLVASSYLLWLVGKIVSQVSIGCRDWGDAEADGGGDEEKSGRDGSYEEILGGENERVKWR